MGSRLTIRWSSCPFDGKAISGTMPVQAKGAVNDVVVVIGRGRQQFAC
jgi:hypothetical protein